MAFRFHATEGIKYSREKHVMAISRTAQGYKIQENTKFDNNKKQTYPQLVIVQL